MRVDQAIRSEVTQPVTAKDLRSISPNHPNGASQRLAQICHIFVTGKFGGPKRKKGRSVTN